VGLAKDCGVKGVSPFGEGKTSLGARVCLEHFGCCVGQLCMALYMLYSNSCNVTPLLHVDH